MKGCDFVDKRQRRKIVAKQHIKEMDEKYSKKIEKSIRNSKIYDNAVFVVDKKNTPEIIIDDIDSVGAIFKYCSENTTILNFASFRKPGGGFTKGSIAQEEALCHESILYNVLSGFDDYYKYNNEYISKSNNSLYADRAIYSPGVIFVRENQQKNVNVITCAAPNRASERVRNVTYEENYRAIKSRVRFVLGIAEENKTDVLILGAWGCGVFGQNASEIAQVFKDEINKNCNIKKIIFAIPQRDDKNYERFLRVFL